MQTFLNTVAQHIVSNHENELGDIAIVLPNKRANLFLKKELGNCIKKNTWAPQIFSLEDFILELTELKKLDQVDLIFDLYEVHKEIEGSNAQELDEFMNWGSILLHDFNEIDRYLIDSKELYLFLSEARAIEQWNPEDNKLTDFQNNYLNFWRNLNQYYSLFKKRILSKKAAYQGLIFRTAAENLGKTQLKSKYSKIYFTGFNALTESEKKIIDYFKEEFQAETLFDADEFYINNHKHEAGIFLRQFLKEAPNSNWVQTNLKSSSKEISIYGISGNIGQAKLIGHLLSETKHIDKAETAVVLADEAILVPVLDSLPNHIDKVNVTMGYPIINSSFYHFFEKYLQLIHSKEKEDYNGLYGKDLIEFLSHPSFKKLNNEIRQEIRTTIHSIEKQKLIFIPTEELKNIDSILTINLFNEHNLKEVIKNLIQFCNKYAEFNSKPLQQIETETIFAFYRVFNRLSEIIENASSAISLRGIIQIFKQVIATSTVSFIGEPLEGLQLMGVLETRTLDFKHLIVSSVNEGVLPSGKSHNSFIPYDIKRKFGLPSYKDKDAIFSYHFFRLLQRAEKVSIIYNTMGDKLGGGEKSRFILQIENELEKYNSSIKINHQIISNIPLKKEINQDQIIQDSDYASFFIERLKKGLSSSALNTYLNCPLDFYHKYYLNLNDEEVITEFVDPRSFGNIVHLSLEKLYQPLVNQKLTENNLSQLKTKVNEISQIAFEHEFNCLPNSGHNMLAFEMAKIYILNQINYDLNLVKQGNEIIIKGLEEKFSEEIPLSNGLKFIRTKGIFDRIDLFNGEIRIIDFKTGSVSTSDLNIGKIENLINGKSPKATQMLLYLVSISKKYPNAKVGIISLKNTRTEFLELKFGKYAPKEITSLASCFELIMDAIWESINIEPLIESHNQESKYCTFCN